MDNEHLSFEAPIAQATGAHTPVTSAMNLECKKLREFGLSTYDNHTDEYGCCYSSWRRPTISPRPKHRLSAMNFPWSPPADLSLRWWMEHAGHEYDLPTDLHSKGASTLNP
ncbi:MAG: hypothetical protein OXE85_07550 [Roseovarius sp.]|nr:hypothetical protein [Roseovarius sp.]